MSGTGTSWVGGTSWPAGVSQYSVLCAHCWCIEEQPKGKRIHNRCCKCDDTRLPVQRKGG